MVHSLKILDKDYKQWVKQIAVRYRGSQIKAAIKVNTEQLRFYWQLGKDIVEMKVEERWGEYVITQLSKDLQKLLPGVKDFPLQTLDIAAAFICFILSNI